MCFGGARQARTAAVTSKASEHSLLGKPVRRRIGGWGGESNREMLCGCLGRNPCQRVARYVLRHESWGFKENVQYF